ncbi:uncharacterized protein LOC125296426 isoform X2 [Alosa alosa]|uniref:uncharacterized protein LOC125296426 isoform X2 n=1 Tax=Alosa alosa TaxID=278164 RepID=UPI0020150DEA|nr:uncharacterized protein LOC125296426 isoform X2 [Alosa alosa]
MMKRPLDLVMTSWLCILGQCSCEVAQKGIEVNCLYDAEIGKVTCSVAFHGMAECEVVSATLCDMDDICIKREALTVDVMDPKEQEYTFTAYTECGVATTSVNITLPPGKLDKFEKEYPGCALDQETEMWRAITHAAMWRVNTHLQTRLTVSPSQWVRNQETLTHLWWPETQMKPPADSRSRHR